MATFFYIVDGISEVAFKKLSGDRVLENVLKKKPSLDFENLYGFDCTAHSFASIVSGKNPSCFNVLNYRNSRFLNLETNLIDELIDAGFEVDFISNNYSQNRVMFLNKFSNIYFFYEKYPFPEIKQYHHYKRDRVVFVHDMYTHDQNGKYSKGKFTFTKQEYFKLIEDHLTKILPLSLKNLGFNIERDNLVLVSDHGMTIGDIKKIGKKNEWAFPSLDFKSKVIGKAYFSSLKEKVKISDPVNLTVLYDLLHQLVIKDKKIFKVPSNTNFFLNLGNSALIKQNLSKINQIAYFEKIGKKKFRKYICQLQPRIIKYTECSKGMESVLLNVKNEKIPENFAKLIKETSNLKQNNVFAELHANYFNYGFLRHYLFILPKKILRSIIMRRFYDN